MLIRVISPVKRRERLYKEVIIYKYTPMWSH